jgi:hypothetical protein
VSGPGIKWRLTGDAANAIGSEKLSRQKSSHEELLAPPSYSPFNKKLTKKKSNSEAEDNDEVESILDKG